MARTSPKLGQRSRKSNWISRAPILSESARTKLAQAIGSSAAADSAQLEKIYVKVQHAIGAYSGAHQAVDNAPRASDYEREYGQLQQDAEALLKGLARFSERMKEDLEAELTTVHTLELPTIERNIRLLAAALEARYRVYAAESEDGGRPRSQAIEMLINTLCSIFADCYSEAERPIRVKNRGAIRVSSDRDAQELRFVRVALSVAGGRLDDSKLKRLVRRQRQGKKSPG